MLAKPIQFFFTRKRKACFLPDTNVTVDNVSVPWDNSLKYLGCYLDSKLTFNLHITKTVDKINKTICILYPFINRNSKLYIHNKMTIFKVIFYP